MLHARRLTSALAVLAGAAVMVLAVPAHAQSPTYESHWAAQGPPLGLALDREGNVLVTSSEQAGVAAMLYAGSGSGELLRSYAHGGGYEAYGVAVDTDGDVLVADYYGRRVQRFAADGTFEEEWPTGGGSATYLAVDDEHNVYVTDPAQNMVRKFSPHGSPLLTWPTARALGIAHRAGIVYVVAREGGVVSKFSTSGTPLGIFGGDAVTAEQLAVDAAGRTYVSDFGGYRLLVYAPDGTLEQTIGGTVPGYPLGVVRYHCSVGAIDGTLYAGDYTHNAVLLLYSPVTPVTRESWGSAKVRYR